MKILTNKEKSQKIVNFLKRQFLNSITIEFNNHTDGVDYDFEYRQDYENTKELFNLGKYTEILKTHTI